METRSIAIGLVAVVAAFAAAFGLAKSGGSKTETAGAGVKAATIKVAAAPAVAGVEVGGTLPSLKAERKAPAKKKAKKQAASSPSTTNSTPSTQNSAPSTQNSAPAPQASNPAPSASNPPASRPSNPAPITSGGTHG
jgi:hypothetical protein